MLNYGKILTPITLKGFSIIKETMAIAEFFPDENNPNESVIFLVAYFVRIQKVKSTPYRKPKEFKLNQIVDAVKSFDISVADIALPSFMLVDDSVLGEKAIEQREHRYQMVTEALTYGAGLYYRHHGDGIIASLANKYKMKREKVQELINEFYRGKREKNSLLSYRGRSRTKPSRAYKKLGRKRVNADEGDIGKNISDDDIENMGIIGRKLLLGEFHQPFEFAYNEFLKKHHGGKEYISQDGVNSWIEVDTNTCISLDQFYRHMPEALEISRSKFNQKRKNRKHFEANEAPIEGTYADYCFGPGHVYQMDSTPMDLELVFNLDRSRLIGIATLYVIRDVYTMAIAGLHIGMGEASYKEARIALFNTIRNKKKFAAEYGMDLLDDDFIPEGKPAILLVDNEEFQNNISEGVASWSSIEVRFARAYRGDDKGLVESSFQMIHSFFKRAKFPGFKYKNLMGRNRLKPKREAAVTIYEAMRSLIAFAVDHNSHKQNPLIALEAEARRQKVPEIPDRVWEWGLENRFYIPEPVSEKQLYIQLLETVWITPIKGVFSMPVTGLNYTIRGNPIDKSILNKAVNSRSKKSFACKYLRQLTNFIFIEVNGIFYPAELIATHRAYKNLSYDECTLIKEAHQKDSKRIEKDNLKYALGLNQVTQSMIDEATSLTKKDIKESGKPRNLEVDQEAKAIEGQILDQKERDRLLGYFPSNSDNDTQEGDEGIPHEHIITDDDSVTEDSNKTGYQTSMISILKGLNNDDSK
jgi:hypothetical protein